MHDQFRPRGKAFIAEAKQMIDALVHDRQGGTIAATAAVGGIALIAGLRGRRGQRL